VIDREKWRGQSPQRTVAPTEEEVCIYMLFWVWWSDCSSGSCIMYLLKGKFVCPHHESMQTNTGRSLLVCSFRIKWTRVANFMHMDRIRRLMSSVGGLVSPTVGLHVSG
jgi:hypothetical protein